MIGNTDKYFSRLLLKLDYELSVNSRIKQIFD